MIGSSATGETTDGPDWLVAEFARLVMEQATRDKGAALGQVLTDFRLALQKQLTDVDASRRSESTMLADIAGNLQGLERNFATLTKTISTRTNVDAVLNEQSRLIKGMQQQMQSQLQAVISAIAGDVSERAGRDSSLALTLTTLQSEVGKLSKDSPAAMQGQTNHLQRIESLCNELVRAAGRAPPPAVESAPHGLPSLVKRE